MRIVPLIAIDTKKRKITAIKKNQRGDRLDDAAAKNQSSWLKFTHNKASSRSRCGFLSGKPKDSIFKVAENLEGRVGFMGSGKDMTTYAEPKKFTYQYV